MSVDVKRYNWHKTEHNRLSADPAFIMLPMDTVGVYFRLRLLAAHTNNNGSMSIGSNTRMTEDDVVNYAALCPGITKRRARAIIGELVAAQLLTVARRNSVIMLTGWADEQGAPQTKWAEWKRQQRSRKSPNANRMPGGCAAPGAQVSGQESGQVSGLDMSSREKLDMSSRIRPEEPDLRKEMYISLNPEPEPEEPRAGADRGQTQMETGSGRASRSARCAQGAPGAAQPPGMPRDFDDLRMYEPVEAACILVGEHGGFARNTFACQMRKLQERYGEDQGEGVLWECMGELWGHIREGKKIRTSRSALLNAIIKRRMEGGAA